MNKNNTTTLRKKKMLAMYLSGKKLREIGEMFSVTRERVRQILHTDNDYNKYIREHGKNIIILPLVESVCINCGNKRFDYRSYHRRKFCSINCIKEYTNKIHNLPTRRCSMCKNIKPKEDFYPKYNNKVSANRLSSICKKCHKKLCRKWTMANPDKKKPIAKRGTTKYNIIHGRICGRCGCRILPKGKTN